jgi:hypothetical protein
VISREDERKIGAVAVSHNVNGAEAELLDDRRRVIRVQPSVRAGIRLWRPLKLRPAMGSEVNCHHRATDNL